MLPKAYADSIKRWIHIETMLIILILFYYFILHIRADFVHFPIFLELQQLTLLSRVAVASFRSV